jgi:hypothetical protein
MWLSKYDDDRMILVTADLVIPRVFTSNLSTLTIMCAGGVYWSFRYEHRGEVAASGHTYPFSRPILLKRGRLS